MKDHILKILEMQEEGKLTREQAAELLAALADGAREKKEQYNTGAPRPEGEGGVCGCGGGAAGGAPGAFKEFVEKVTEVGASVGRSATVWGGEVMNAVHREEGGNSVTLSKMEAPTVGGGGEGSVFTGNVLSMSKMGRVELTRGELARNVFTASKFSRVEITDGKFVQSDVNGSALTEIAVTGSVVRAVVFTGVKCARWRLEGNSALDGCTVQASSLKGITFGGGSLRGVVMTGCSISDLTVKQTTVSGGKWSDCKVDGLLLENCELENCQFVGCVMRGTRIVGVKASGRVVRNLDLSGKVIEGEEGFLREVG
ncbi:MAG: pentapeptide repeat-containing protein [Phycisphaerae bacterium]